MFYYYWLGYISHWRHEEVSINLLFQVFSGKYPDNLNPTTQLSALGGWWITLNLIEVKPRTNHPTQAPMHPNKAKGRRPFPSITIFKSTMKYSD